MACCIIGALIISQVLALWRRIRHGLRMTWAVVSVTAGVGLLSFGAGEMAFASPDHGPESSGIIAWCFGDQSGVIAP